MRPIICHQYNKQHSITSWEDIIIKPSDKGGNVVVMDKNAYISMCYKILENQDWYQQVPHDKLTVARPQYLSIIDRAHQQGLIDRDTREYLEIKLPVTSTFYSIPKVHKSIINPLDAQ